jgi:outer membrane protein assembly factor BamB
MNYPDNTEIRLSPLYQGLMGGSIAAMVFAGIAAALLIANVYSIEAVAPQKAGQLSEMEKQFDTQPNNPDISGLAEQIRTFDAQIRRDELRRQRFAQTGAIYFIVSLLAGVGSFTAARLMLRPAPAIPTQPVCPGQSIQRAMQVRMATTVVCVVIASVAMYAILRESAGSKSRVPVAAVDWSQQVQGQWPSFRGPWGDGVTEQKDIPTLWNEKENKGIIWKAAAPLVGHSSPIVWGDKIFLSGATKDEQKIFCYSAKDGKSLWTSSVKPAGSESRGKPDVAEDTGYAACTPATNGAYVCAIFATGDVGCFDMQGKVRWQKALGIPESTYGYAASLAVFNDLVIVQFDQGTEAGKSELIAMNLSDGKVAWRTKRSVPNSWTSPTVVKTEKGYRILTSGSPWVMGYEPQTGRELWKASCLASDIAPTQILAGGLVLAIQPYDRLCAVRMDNAGGDVTQTAMAWQVQGEMPDICSPVSDGKLVWTLTSNGTLSCFDLTDGKEVYKQSLEGDFNASPSLVGDKLYILKENGQMIISQAGREYREIGRCAIEENGCFASPAFASGRIYLRSAKSLYCIGQKQ